MRSSHHLGTSSISWYSNYNIRNLAIFSHLKFSENHRALFSPHRFYKNRKGLLLQTMDIHTQIIHLNRSLENISI